MAQKLIQDPGLPDSVRVDTVTVKSTEPGIVPVNFVNDEPLAGIEVTLEWESTDVILDSVSFLNSRISYVAVKGMTSDDSTVTMFCFPYVGQPLIAPGSGLFARLFFSYPPTVDTQVVAIDTITVIKGDREYATTFSDSLASNFRPQFRSGYLHIWQNLACCVGDRGNVDGDVNDLVNVADLTYLVSFLFTGGPEPPCESEANIDGDVNNRINVADLTYLVGFMFAGGPPPPPC
ncbi:MAG TPA: hypothetical protein VN285_00860 [Candidatus Deferrimicrobium sp.]|nr:hypothetical protein [Candidatus Deferrimicrobium sp.]